MTGPSTSRWPLPRALRRSMTARIGASIAFVGLLLVGSYALVIDHLVAQELRDQNELQLLASLSFLRDDLRAADGGTDAVRAGLEREALRHQIQAQILRPDGTLLLRSSPFDAVASGDLGDLIDMSTLPAGQDLAGLRRVRSAGTPVSRLWQAPDGRRYRLVHGRVTGVSARSGLPAEVEVLLALAPTKTEEVRRGEELRIALAVTLALLVGGGLGVVLARHAVADARRMGATANQISVQALHERLSLADVPDELRESAQAFNRMLDRLQASFERLSRFSAEVAHDLRTPISNLLGEAQVALSRDRSAEEYREVLASAVEEYERMSRMIANMLFLARSDNDQTVLALEPLALDVLLERVAAYFDLVADERGVRLDTTVHRASAAPADLLIDDTLVVRALGNLVSNALRYAPRGSTVTLAGQAEGPAGVSISVTNTGPAIPPEHLDKIFDRFYRVSPSREDSASGSGLGLAIVQSIMELHGGAVEVRSDARATVFTLWFPAEQVSHRT